MNRRVIAALAVVVIGLPIVFQLFFIRIHPMDIGVRQARWGGGGIEFTDFTTGFHIDIVGYHRWYTLPRTTHFLHFNADTGARGSRTPTGPRNTTTWAAPLELRTKDQNQTTIEVTVPYRIIPGKAHMILKDGYRNAYRSRVESTVLSELRTELSELSSEDLQSTDMRLARVEELLPELNVRLAEYHCVAERILIRRVSFPPEYEQKLQSKQYITQLAELDGAQALQANEEQVTNSIERQIGAEEKRQNADWDLKIQEEKSKYEVLIAEIHAEAAKYEAQVRAAAEATQVSHEAEGQLAIDQAEALRNELRNDILNSRGGDIFLALEAASNLRMPKIVLNSNDPRVPIVLDIDAMTKLLLGGSSKSKDADK